MSLRIQTAISKDITLIIVANDFIMSTFLFFHRNKFASLDYIKSFVQFALSYNVLIQMNWDLFDQILQFISLLNLKLFQNLNFV